LDAEMKLKKAVAKKYIEFGIKGKSPKNY